ncbi:MAG: type II CRISPR RNA-guided endonuclease Cas9 [Terriglobia bacterium]
MPKSEEFILGIDLGTDSLGWALVMRENGAPRRLERAGTRIFDSGMDETKGLGKEESRNLARRDARLHRRQLWRRGRRLAKVFNILQDYSLLPENEAKSPEARQDLLNRLDQEIVKSSWFESVLAKNHIPEPLQKLPYLLRAASLDSMLSPYYLGRAFFHLAQRRGFLSNRKQAPKKKDDDEGKVKEGIKTLREKMTESGARTLGEYFARLSPSEERIRGRWTARDMYEKEFEAMWDAQFRYSPETFTFERKKKLFRAIFHQRPLKIKRGLIGKCELEPGQRRAPRYLLTSQRFRLLQRVNDLKVIPPDEPEKWLTPADRVKLAEALELKGDLTFKQARKFLSLPEDYAFNLERGGEKTLRGNRTASALYKVFGEQWHGFSRTRQDEIVNYLNSFQKPERLAAAAQKKFDLTVDVAKRFSEVTLESDYMNLSRRAMEKLLPLLEAGMAYSEARKQVYPESFECSQPKESLLPAEKALPALRNPAVERSLTELRKVVNAIIRQYGKPAEIRVELARELKKAREDREAIAKAMRDNEAARKKAAEKILEETGIYDPSRDDIRRALLAEECRWVCPYTGKSISMRQVIGHEPQFDTEHIIPFSRSLDDSFANLTLCEQQENRNVKKNQTPHQAYASDPERYQQILDRVARFNGDRRRVQRKLERFMMDDTKLEELLEKFSARRLTDTAYATKLAAQYLGQLYGGISDADGKLRVRVTSGGVTAYLRSLWKLNAILGDGPTRGGGWQPKERADHRHHAIDAVVIALTDQSAVKKLADAAERAPQEGRRKFVSLEGPWPGFTDSVRAEVERIVVSHRVSRKVSGALHEETIYSPPIQRKDGAMEQRVRKPLASFTMSDLNAIVDPKVKELVLQKLAELGGDVKKFKDNENLPFFIAKDGRRIPIRKVRIKKTVKTFPLGDGRTARNVTNESNHHLEIYAEIKPDGSEGKWDGEVVSMREAYERKKAGKPIVQRDHGPLVKFKFSLAPGEIIECESQPGEKALFIVRGISQFATGYIQCGMVSITDSRKKADIVKAEMYLRPGLDKLRQWHAQKVSTGPLGEVVTAHD